MEKTRHRFIVVGASLEIKWNIDFIFANQAPYFGEDDNRVCLAAGVISRDQEIVCPVDEVGCFILPVTDFEGDDFSLVC
jgi:hypothetical protein